MDILLNMEQTTAAARLYMPSPTLNRPNYISMFRIDGVPILPPLMTNEKRKQMKKLKEKAMELEKTLEAKRRQRTTNDLREEIEDGIVPYSPPFSENCPSSRSNFSSVSQCSSEMALPEQQDTYLLLSNIMNSAQERREFKDSSTCTQGADNDADALLLEKARQLKARMQKLQKSETLIYDNCSNTIIMPISSQQNLAAKQQDNDYELKQVLEHPNFGYRSLEQQIPVICVNPPTPMMSTRTFCEKLNTSVDSLTGDLVSRVSSDESSTDESGNFNPSAHALKSHKKVTNITAKIIQFETFCDGGSGALERLEPPCIKPPLRSATSPSLKPPTLSPNSTKIIHHKSNAVDSHSDNPLVRSNSFTLDVPSKALLDHIRQQKIAVTGANHNQNAKRSCYPSASATRDTVESKAKRVQKVELKPRPQAMRNAAKSTALSPYTTNSNNSKKQRSPYELKSGHKTKVLRPLKTASTSPSSTGLTALRQVKPKNSLTTLTSRLGSNHNKNNSSSKALQPELLSEIEAEHRQKFVQLVAQQNEEKKRLQLSFEAQQKLLLEQISVDMDKVQFCKRSAAAAGNPIINSSQEVSPISGSERSDHAEKMSPPLSLGSSTNSYSVISSTICDLNASTEDQASLESTITTTTTTLTSNRHCTPRRRLFSREHSPTLSAKNMLASTAATTAAASVANKRREYHIENQRRYEAATKICACARGFLTRRLFQTEQIQRIVQTIRDTLIFVLNLHLESSECPEEANTAANIKLKARLLQQLSSASRTLHLVFFQTTIKERMDIIARDRKRIKTKLLSMNMKRSSPRIAT